MSAIDDSRTLGRARLSFANEAEIDEFAATLDRFERGEIGPAEWRAFRLVRGTYGQRQEMDAQMLRAKIPQGILDGLQLRALADVADRYSRGFGHLTTRQNMQFHFVKLHDVELAMRVLADAGLTTREACGNAVRNITGCPYAGVAEDEPFDVTPYAEALARYLLRHPLSSTLPRKFKIAFEGCAEDHALTAINDLGWRAVVRDGERGFRVTVAGGTAVLTTSGYLLFEFLPAGDVLAVAEAVLRVYARLGDYEHRQRNRLKYLIKQLGFDAWREHFDAALAEVRAEGAPALPFPSQRPDAEEAPDWRRAAPPTEAEATARAEAAEVRGPGLVPAKRGALPVLDTAFARWAATNVRAQKQAGYAAATVTVPLGDLTSAQLRILADLAEAYGDATVRTTQNQNLLVRWVRTEELPELYRRLAAAGLGLDGANTFEDVTSCPGAETCRLAVTQSRGVGKLLGDYLRERPDLVAVARGLDVKISGCPNGCGLHHVAGVGLQGSIRRVDGKVAPQYFLTVGGGVDDDGAHFGRLVAKIPARRVPEAVERLLTLYTAEHDDDETPLEFFRRVDTKAAKQALANLDRIGPEDFVDLGDEEEMKLVTLEGECVA